MGQGLPKQKIVDTFIYIIRPRVAFPVLGMVRFRRRSSFCDAYGWVVLTTQWNEWTAIHISFLPSWPIPFLLTLSKALYGFWLPKQPTQQKQNNQLLWRPSCGLQGSASWSELQVPRLNTPGLFSFGGEDHLGMFPLFIDNCFSETCVVFSLIWGEMTWTIPKWTE